MSCLCQFTGKEGERGCISAGVLTQSKGKGTSIGIGTNKSLFTSPSVKGHLVSPLHSPSSYFIHVFVCCVVYFCTPWAWQSVKKEMCKCYEMDGWMFTLSSKGELLGCRLGVFIILCNIWALAPKWLDSHLRFEDVVTQKPLFLSP